MKILKKPKTSLILLIIALVILALTGSYFFYAQSLLKKTTETDDTVQVRQNSQDNGLIDNQEINNKNNQVASIPEDWKEYELAGCGVKVYIPSDWQIESNSNEKSVIFNSNDTIKSRENFVKNGGVWEGYHDLTINCYNSLDNFIDRSNWKWIKESYSDLAKPNNLFDALTQIRPSTDNKEKITINNITEIKKNIYGNKEALQGLVGGFGESINIYFQNNQKIVEFVTDQFTNVSLPEEPQKTIVNTFNWLE